MQLLHTLTVRQQICRFSIVFLAVTALQDGVSKAGRPNIILIMADDLGYGDISCYGSKLNQTPVLDKLAASGLRLADYHAGSTVCTPSRMALMTGCYPPRLGWKGGVLGYKMNMSGGLASEAITMAEVFKEAGYRTCLSGKWHLGNAPERLPNAQGFDHAFYITASNNQTKQLWRNDKLVADPFDNSRLTEEFTREAITFILQESDQPFFLYLPYTAPHFPVEAHPDWSGHSMNAAYGDVVEELDARVGEIIECLDELKIREETIVIFTSDNGPQGGRKNKTVADPYRGGKWSSLEGGTRVPCIVSWPGVLPVGQEFRELVASIDLLPTLADACEIELDRSNWKPTLDGVSVWETLSGQQDTKQHTRQDMLYWDGWAASHAIRLGKWKLYFTEVKDIAGSSEGPVLIDLSVDIKERVNRAADHPQRVTDMLSIAKHRLDELAEDTIGLGGEPQKFPEPKRAKWLEGVLMP